MSISSQRIAGMLAALVCTTLVAACGGAGGNGGSSTIEAKLKGKDTAQALDMEELYPGLWTNYFIACPGTDLASATIAFDGTYSTQSAPDGMTIEGYPEKGPADNEQFIILSDADANTKMESVPNDVVDLCSHHWQAKAIPIEQPLNMTKTEDKWVAFDQPDS